MVSGREHHLLSLGEDHGLQHVHDLGDVGHLQAGGVLLENVQREGRHNGIPHGVLLEQVAGVVSRLHVEPGSPLVQQQGYPALGIVGVHDGLVVAEHLVNLYGFGQGVVVFLGRKVRGRSLAARPTLAGIVVQRQAVHLGGGVLHHGAGPVIVVVGGAAGHLEQAVVAVIAGIQGITLVNVGIILGGHVAAAAPRFIAHAQILYFPGLFPAVLGAELGHGTVLGRHVFHPLGQLFHGAGAHVAADVRLDAQHLAKVQELMGAEGVVLHGAAPVVVHQLGPVFLGADPVHPMVLVGEAAAGPAEHRHFQGLESFQDVGPIAIYIGDGGIRSHPDTFVDAPAQMLGELAVNLGRDYGLVLRGLVHGNFYLGLGQEGYGQCRKGKEYFLHSRLLLCH